MYHNHIFQRDDSKTIKKIYEKLKINCVKGNWFQLSLKDFEFIKKDLKKKEICEMPKKKHVLKILKIVIKKAVFEFFMNKKFTH